MAAKKKAKASKAPSKSNAKALAIVRPIRERLTKSALLNLISEKTGYPRKQVAETLIAFESVVLGSVHPSGAGEFALPGILKVTLRKIPARPAGTLIRNPATGEMMRASAKPASVRVKVRALSKLKKAAVK